MNTITKMETVAAKVVGPRDGRAGFLGSIGVRFMIDGEEAGERFSLVEHPLSARALAAPLHRHARDAARGGGRDRRARRPDLQAAQPVAHLLERRRSTGAASRDHLASRVRAILRRARRAGRSRASRTVDSGRPLRSLRAPDEPRQRPRADPALRSALPRRADLARPPRPLGTTAGWVRGLGRSAAWSGPSRGAASN
jgi:hypothetical protein